MNFLISAVVLISQHLLGESKNKWLGGIIPLLVILLAIWFFFLRTPKLGANSIFPFCVLFLLLLWDWADGRKRFHKREAEEIENELKKMQAHDLDDK